jgi:hypothetical protein
MNMSVISSAYAYSGVQPNVTGSQQSVKSRDSDGDQDGSSSSVSRGGGNGVLGAVFQALGQLGLNVPAQSASQSAASQATSSSTSSSQAASSGDVKQALQSFMHDLFQAMRGSGSSGNTASNASTASNSSAGNRYGELASKLEGLAQQLNTSSGSGTLNNLQSSFNNLVKALGNGSNSGNAQAASNAPTLQGFLQNLSQGLQGGSLNPVGSLVSTAA